MEKKVKFALIPVFLLIVCLMFNTVSATCVHNINNTSYGTYFNASGYMKDSSNIHAGDMLNIYGTIKNKNMYIDRPLNVTSISKTGKLVNGTITILKTGSGTNITNLFIDNSNQNGIIVSNATNNKIAYNTINANQNSKSYGIYLDHANKNKISGNKVSTTGDKITYGIYLDGSNFNTLNSNTINTKGAAADVDWSNWMNGGIYATISLILDDSSSNNTISNNSITTSYNKVTSTVKQDTILGVHIHNDCNNNTVKFNTINTTGYSYVYGLDVTGASGLKANNNIISENIINTNGNYYANSVKVGSDSKNTTVSKNKITASAKTVAYGVYLENFGELEAVLITENNVSTKANVNYVMELYGASNQIITNNVLSGIGNYTIGIGTYNSKNNTIKNNTITTIGNNSASTINTGDAIPGGNEGIKLYSNSNSNIITSNIIRSSAIYAIDASTSKDNSITNNYLLSNGTDCSGNESVTGTQNIIKDNYAVPIAKFTTNSTIGTIPLKIRFTDQSKYATSWNWNFGDGSTSTLKNPVHTYTKPGKYQVILTINQDDLKISKILTITVKSNDTKSPAATASVKSGRYNVSKVVSLKMSEAGTIYYTLNGSTPSLSSSRYVKSLVISSTKTLKYFAVDTAGNKSPVYTVSCVIDKTAPKVVSATPKNGATSVSRSGTLVIRFSEHVNSSVNWSKVYLKNVSTGKSVSIRKMFKGNSLIIKTNHKLTAKSWYRVYIPSSAIKDDAGNHIAQGLIFNFKTGRN
ncbi:MAG: Ig-like domain-containing protein [Methanobacterium sp. ERen5]|nr:MAG: Ig-like domain-containing protein [Methanobacterium sp. ERen5]